MTHYLAGQELEDYIDYLKTNVWSKWTEEESRNWCRAMLFQGIIINEREWERLKESGMFDETDRPRVKIYGSLQITK